MDGLLQALVTGVTAFVSTNLDDLIILMLFFSQVDAHFRPRHIVLGQYLGFSLIILASLPGFLGGLILPKQWIGLLGFVPIVIGIHSLLHQPTEEVQTVSQIENHSWFKRLPIVCTLTSLIPPQTYHVSVVTFANGGDNIGIYLPLFTSVNLSSLAVILGVFLLLVGVWCYVAYHLAHHPTIAPLFTQYGKKFVPFVLIGLGLFILLESKSYQLLSGQAL